MSKNQISTIQMKSIEIYEKITDHVSNKGYNYKILEYYLNLGIIDKNSSPDLLNNIFKSKDLINKYNNSLNTLKLPENPINKMQYTIDYEPSYEEIENHSFGFIEPQIKYSYIVYLLNEISKRDEYYYIAFYELSKMIKFDRKYILNFDNDQAYDSIKKEAKRNLYLSYKSSPELLSWRYWMQIFQADQNRMTFHTYSIFDFVRYLLETYSYDIPILFEEVDVRLVYLLSHELFGVKKYNLMPTKLSFPKLYDLILSDNPNLSQEKIKNIKNILFEFEITKKPSIKFLKLHKEPNVLSQITLEYFKSVPNFIDALESNEFNLSHIIFNLCYCLEIVRNIDRSSPDEDYLYELIESISEKGSKYTINIPFSMFCDNIIYYLMDLRPNKTDFFMPFFELWIYVYKNHDEYFDDVHEAIINLLKVVARVSNYTTKSFAEEIRETEKPIIFGFDYINLLPENIKIMKQIAYECNQLNDQVKSKVFNKLSRLHSSELWNKSIEFLKTYYNDKRMTIGVLRNFLDKNKNEISQPKNLNLLDYLRMNNNYSDQEYKKYLDIQRSRIEFSYINYLIYETIKMNLEAIYLLSKRISIDEKYFMKRILSRKFYILDVIIFQMSAQYLSVPKNFLAGVRIQLPGLLYPLGKNEFKFCQEIVSKYPLDLHLVYPLFDVNYDRGTMKLFSRSRYMLQGSNYEDAFDYSNYLFFFFYEANEVDSMFQGFAQSAFCPNQYFRNIFDISEENSSGFLLKHFISLFVSSYECLKPTEKINEETRNFIVNCLSVPYKRSLLVDVLTGNDNASNDPEYTICKQILDVKENQKENFSKFYEIMKMFDSVIDPYKQSNFELLRSFDFSKYGNSANKYKIFQSQVISKVINQPGYLASKIKDLIEKKENNYHVIKYYIDNGYISLDDASTDVIQLLIKITEQDEVKENIQFGKVEINHIENDFDISWILDLVEYSEKVKFIYSLRTYDFVNIYKSLQNNDSRQIELTKDYLKTGNSKVLDSYENEISEKYFDTFVQNPEFFNTNNLIKSINNLSLPFKELNERSIDVLNKLIMNYRSDLEISIPLSNFFHFFKHCQEIFPFLSEIDGFWNYKPPKYQSFSGFIKDINKMANKKKIPEDLPKLQEFCNSFDSKEEELYIDDIKYIKNEGKNQIQSLMKFEISQNISEKSDKFIYDLNNEKVTVGLLILRLIQNSNVYDCNMKIFSNYFKERNNEQKLKIDKNQNLSEFYFNLQKEIESKEKIHKTKISIINDINDDLPVKMTKERFDLFQKLLFVDKKKLKLFENSFLDVYNFCEENFLLRYQEQIIGYTLKCIEENNNIFFTNPLKELYKFVLNQVLNEKENEFSNFYPNQKENERIISRIKSSIKQEVINSLKSEFVSLRKKEIKEKIEIFSCHFPKIAKNVPLLMVKPKYEMVNYSFDKMKFYNMILSFNELNLDLSNEEFIEFDFVFQEKGSLTVKNTKTDKYFCYSQSQSPHLFTLLNSPKSIYTFENSNPTWTTIRIPKIRKNFGDCSFENFCQLYQEIENLVKNEDFESQTVFGMNLDKFKDFLGKISKLQNENFSLNFQNHIDSINIDSSYPNTFRVIKKYIDMSKEIKENEAIKSLANIITEKLNKIKEIEIPRVIKQNNRNFHFRLQTKFTPKIFISDDGIKPNFSQIYFYNFNVNFDILEIFIIIEGFFQFLDVSVESSSDIIKSEVVEDKIILTVDLSSKPNKIDGILKVSDINIPISLCFKYEKYNRNGPNFVFSDMKSDLDFRSAAVDFINESEVTKIIEIIESYKLMSDKFSDFFFSYLKSNQQSFPINLLKTFSNLYSLHKFFETHYFDEFCPFYSLLQEFEKSFCKLLRNLSINNSSEEKDFDYYNIFCYKSSNDFVIDDPNIKRKIILIDEQNKDETKTSSENISSDVETVPSEESIPQQNQSNSETEDIKNSWNEEEIKNSNQIESEKIKNSNQSEDQNIKNYWNEEEIKSSDDQNQNVPQMNPMMQQEFNNMQNYFMPQMQMFQMQQSQFMMISQFQRMIPPQIQNNPQAIFQYQQIQNQYQMLQMQISSVQQIAFQFYQQFGVNPINEIGNFQQFPQQQSMFNGTQQQQQKL